MLLTAAAFALLAYSIGTIAMLAIIFWSARHLIRLNRAAEQHFREVEAERMHGARVRLDFTNRDAGGGKGAG